MGNFFNIKRFGKYLTYDLNNACNYFGFCLLVLGLVPLIVFVFQQIFSLAFTQSLTLLPMWAKYTAFGITMVALVIIAPVKLYGRLTEKRAGSDWLMIPASAFEKFLSMVIVLCVVVPAVFFAVLASCDLLLSLIPYYGESMVSSGLAAFDKIVASVNSEVFKITDAGIATIWLSFCTYILTFALGAICFKKSKAAKVILCIIALDSLLSILGMIFITAFDFDFSGFFDDMTPEKAQHFLNTMINICYFVIFGVLLGGIFARIKTLKH